MSPAKKNFKDLILNFKLKNLSLESGNGIKLLIVFSTIVCLFLMLPSYKSIESDFEVGTIWSSEDLIAPFTFPVYKDEKEYEQEKQDVIRNIAMLFDKIDSDGSLNDSLAEFEESVIKILSDAAVLERNKDGYINSESMDKEKEQLGVKLTFPEWEKLFQIYKNEKGSDINITFNKFISIVNQSILDASNNDIINFDKSKIVSKKISVKKENSKLQTDYRY